MREHVPDKREYKNYNEYMRVLQLPLLNHLDLKHLLDIMIRRQHNQSTDRYQRQIGDQATLAQSGEGVGVLNISP